MILVGGAETPDGLGILKLPEEPRVGMVEPEGLLAPAPPPAGIGMVEIVGLFKLEPPAGSGIGMVETPLFFGATLACGRTTVVGEAGTPEGFGK